MNSPTPPVEDVLATKLLALSSANKALGEIPMRRVPNVQGLHLLADPVFEFQHAAAEAITVQDKVIEALRTDLQRYEWQPIETAPHDATDILVIHAENKSVQLVVAYEPDQQNPDYPWITLDGPRYFRTAFSHWIPLPEPPSTLNTISSGPDQ